ncbi:MAG: hypothetical protein VYE77_10710 [Planctomycetota bacterium]|nr:hypothetical protein [Planctomycetota bacterium]
MHRLSGSLLFLALLAACAEGGEEDAPMSEVQVSANHHLFWFRTLPGFATFPPAANEVFTGCGLLEMDNDSTYRLVSVCDPSTPVTGPHDYALANDCELRLFVRSSFLPTTVFLGGYEHTASQPDLFFTDRVTTVGSASVGLYYGTEVENGTVDLEGKWHLLSMHLMLGVSSSAPVVSPRNVGRTAYGDCLVEANPPPATPPTPPGSLLAISGEGFESGSDAAQLPVVFGGSIQQLVQGNPPSGDGTVNLTVDFGPDPRVFRAASGQDIVMALDADESDGNAGMLFLVRQFDDTPGDTLDDDDVVGVYLVGGQTLFVNPANSGSDTFIGKLELFAGGGGSAPLAFRLDAEGVQGVDFSYQGTYSFLEDPLNPGVLTGGIEFNVDGTNEQWFGAINRTYDTITLVDTVVEDRTNNTPELNLLIGVRQQDG